MARDIRANRGRPPITPENHPNLGEAPPKKKRADTGAPGADAEPAELDTAISRVVRALEEGVGGVLRAPVVPRWPVTGECVRPLVSLRGAQPPSERVGVALRPLG